MQLTVNGRSTVVQDGTTVGEVTRETTGSTSPRGVAVALNGEVVPRDDWDARRLEAGDTVEVLTAFAGG